MLWIDFVTENNKWIKIRLKETKLVIPLSRYIPDQIKSSKTNSINTDKIFGDQSAVKIKTSDHILGQTGFDNNTETSAFIINILKPVNYSNHRGYYAKRTVTLPWSGILKIWPITASQVNRGCRTCFLLIGCSRRRGLVSLADSFTLGNPVQLNTCEEPLSRKLKELFV